MRAMKRFPKRQGLCRLHCNELTVICWDCCTATATTCTASYISAASVCKPRQKQEKQIVINMEYSTQQISPPPQHGSVHIERNIDSRLSGSKPYIQSQMCRSTFFQAKSTVAIYIYFIMFLLTYYPLINDLPKIACSMTSDLFVREKNV